MFVTIFWYCKKHLSRQMWMIKAAQILFSRSVYNVLSRVTQTKPVLLSGKPLNLATLAKGTRRSLLRLQPGRSLCACASGCELRTLQSEKSVCRFPVISKRMCERERRCNASTTYQNNTEQHGDGFWTKLDAAERRKTFPIDMEEGETAPIITRKGQNAGLRTLNASGRIR